MRRMLNGSGTKGNLRGTTEEANTLFLMAATGMALLAILMGALLLIAPVVQWGNKPVPYLGIVAATTPTPTRAPLVNINTAAPVQLMQLPGVGEGKAQAIVEYRDAHGAFLSLQDAANVEGVSSDMIDSWVGLAFAG